VDPTTKRILGRCPQAARGRESAPPFRRTLPDVNGDYLRDADAAIARVEQQIAAAQEQAERGRRFQEDVAAVRGSATSPRREVRVTVDASGRLLDVQLADAAAELALTDLSRLIVEAARAAQRDAGEQAVRVAADLFGEEAGATARLRAEIAEAIPPSGSRTTWRW
jgi:DNA-binding protein YbaB